MEDWIASIDRTLARGLADSFVSEIDRSAETPLQRLRDRYVEGRISLDTFEARVELLLARGIADSPGTQVMYPTDEWCRVYAREERSSRPAA